jgi:hypothetical protein
VQRWAEVERIGREGDLVMVKGQIVPDDERSSESCLDYEINDLVQEHVEGQEKFDLVALAANLEEAGTWYYVVDCATCKAVIPFKHAPDDEPILPFPTMRVRCLDCHADHTYAPDLIHTAERQPQAGFSKEIDHLLTRVTAIEKHLGIDKKIAA